MLRVLRTAPFAAREVLAQLAVRPKVRVVLDTFVRRELEIPQHLSYSALQDASAQQQTSRQQMSAPCVRLGLSVLVAKQRPMLCVLPVSSVL